jgi:hypothetical protein
MSAATNTNTLATVITTANSFLEKLPDGSNARFTSEPSSVVAMCCAPLNRASRRYSSVLVKVIGLISETEPPHLTATLTATPTDDGNQSADGLGL